MSPREGWGRRPVNIEGQRFGRLSAVSLVKVPGKQSKWVCICECGVEKVVAANDLRTGNTKSCGCLSRDLSRARCRARMGAALKHGQTKTATYVAWMNMKMRCTNPDTPYFKYYGGRGISYNSRWEKFENFLADMGRKPNYLSLDRINNDGNYSKENCRWATSIQQANNKRPPRKRSA